jgi:hypothetical protein
MCALKFKTLYLLHLLLVSSCPLDCYALVFLLIIMSCVYANCHGFGVPPKHRGLMVLCNSPSYIRCLLYLFLMNLNHLEGINLAIRHPYVYCLAHVCYLAYCWGPCCGIFKILASVLVQIYLQVYLKVLVKFIIHLPYNC